MQTNVQVDNVKALMTPFKVNTINDTILSIEFKKREPIWSANIKRAIASFFQVRGEVPEAIVVNEVSSLQVIHSLICKL